MRSIATCSLKRFGKGTSSYRLLPARIPAGCKLLQEHSVSTVANNPTSASEYIKHMPVHAHWLAVELLQIVKCAWSQLDPPSELTTMEFSVGTQRSKSTESSSQVYQESLSTAFDRGRRSPRCTEARLPTIPPRHQNTSNTCQFMPIGLQWKCCRSLNLHGLS